MNIDRNAYYIIFTFVIVLALYWYFTSTETLENTDSPEVDLIFNYINSTNGTFADYINYLTSIKNTNLNLIDTIVFATFLSRKKKGKFTKQDIIDEMNP